MDSAILDVLIANTNGHLELPRRLWEELVDFADELSPLLATGLPHLGGVWVEEIGYVLEYLALQAGNILALAWHLDVDRDEITGSTLKEG